MYIEETRREICTNTPKFDTEVLKKLAFMISDSGMNKAYWIRVMLRLFVQP